MSVSAYYGYKYAQICKERVQEFVINLLNTVEDTRTTLIELQCRLEYLENTKYNKSNDEIDVSKSYINNYEPFSLLMVNNDTVISEKQEEVTARKDESSKSSTDPYVADLLKVMNNVKKEAAELEERVRYYKGTAGDRVYKQFNEKLIRLLITLDRIEVKGYTILKEEKKEAIEYLKGIQAVLKTK